MKIFIDCEFNGFEGELLSLALVADDGKEFYEVLFHPFIKYEDWVKEHVVPILNKETVTKTFYQHKLQKFLWQYDEIHLIADWPDDIKYFCMSLITGPGICLNTPPITMEINRNLSTEKSAILHNALEDARAISKSYHSLKGAIS